MASAFPESLAMLISFSLNGFLHGIYLTLFIQWVMNPRHRSAALYFVAFCWMAFLTSNIDFGINLYLMIKGFWFFLPQGGPDIFFLNLRNWQTILREVMGQLLVTASDTLMIYRLYRIWGSNIYVTIVPLAVLIAETMTGFMAVGYLSLGPYTKLPTLTTLVLALNTTVQIMLAVLIAIRLLDPKDTKYLRGEHRTRRFQLVRCLVESGLLVAIALIIDLILYVRHISFYWVFDICLPQLYAITTVLIVLRMGNFTDRHPSALSASSHSGAQQTHYSRSVAPSNLRSPVSVILYDEPTSPGTLKSPIAGPHDGIELQGYREQRRDAKVSDVYVHVEREVHHEV